MGGERAWRWPGLQAWQPCFDSGNELLWDPQEGFSGCQNSEVNIQTKQSSKYMYFCVWVGTVCQVCMKCVCVWHHWSPRKISTHPFLLHRTYNRDCSRSRSHVWCGIVSFFASEIRKASDRGWSVDGRDAKKNEWGEKGGKKNPITSYKKQQTHPLLFLMLFYLIFKTILCDKGL